MNKHDLVLHHYWRSSCSWRLRWALALKRLKYKSHPVNLLKGEQHAATYLKLSPSGSVPCLQIDGVPFTQSLAIIEWLDEQYPSPQLLPTAAADRLRARQLSLVLVADTQPLQNLAVQNFHSSDPTQRVQFATHWIQKGLSVFEQLVTPTAGTYCLGATISIADLCLIPQCYNALRFGVDLRQFPTVHMIYQNALKTPECDASAPHNQPDSIPNTAPLRR